MAFTGPIRLHTVSCDIVFFSEAVANELYIDGWEGDEKAFFFEFSMPSDGTTGFNADMPALWMLNAEIPRTLQYGKPEC